LEELGASGGFVVEVAVTAVVAAAVAGPVAARTAQVVVSDNAARKAVNRQRRSTVLNIVQ
jgi:hypothetical protein